MASHPSWGVEVALKSQLLFAGNQVGIRRVHVLGRRRDLLLLKSGIQIGWVGQVGVVAVQGGGISVALKHPEKTVRQKRRRGCEVIHIRLPRLRRDLGGELGRKKHAVPLEHGCAGNHERGLLHRLKVAVVEG
jgi:hypothetical protein